MNLRKYKREFLILLLIIIGISKVVFDFYESETRDNLTFSEDIIPEYDSLFISKHKTLGTYKSDLKNPISVLDCKLKYSFIVCKLQVNAGDFFNHLHINSGSSSQSPGLVYFIVNESHFDLAVKSDSVKTSNDVFFTLDGDPIEVVSRNDTIISCMVNFNTFSIRYAEKGPVDMYAEVKPIIPTNKKIEANIVFLKKNNSVYFMVLTANDVKHKIEKNMLVDLLRH